MQDLEGLENEAVENGNLTCRLRQASGRVELDSHQACGSQPSRGVSSAFRFQALRPRFGSPLCIVRNKTTTTLWQQFWLPPLLISLPEWSDLQKQGGWIIVATTFLIIMVLQVVTKMRAAFCHSRDVLILLACPPHKVCFP